MLRSTASTTTIASSTTMPIANTSPNSVRVLIEKPSSSKTEKVPTSATGTAEIGMIVARQLCRKRKMTSETSADRFQQRLDDLAERLAERRGWCRGTRQSSRPGSGGGLRPVHDRLACRGLQGVGTRLEEHADEHRRVPVERADEM